MKIVYISSVRLPTEKAHGVQIVRMCEAFASLGAQTTLLNPRRYQEDASLGSVDPLDYYGVQTKFDIQTLKNFDVYRLINRTPTSVFRFLSVAHSAIWERHLAREARRHEASLYFSRDATPIAARILAQSGHPTVIEFHEEHHGIALRSLRKAVHAPGFRFAVAMTSHLAEEIRSNYGLPRAKVHVLPDGVGIKQFNSANQRLRDSATPKVMYVGSLLENRGVKTLVEAARLLPEVEVHIVGGLPKQLERLSKIADHLGLANVFFHGQVQHSMVPTLLGEADIAVLPMSGTSRHTSHMASPMKLFEYMAAGKPIVASDLPSIREIVEHGTTAWLVEPDDWRNMASGIRHLLSNPDLARRLGSQARIEARAFTWESRASQILETAGLLRTSANDASEENLDIRSRL